MAFVWDNSLPDDACRRTRKHQLRSNAIQASAVGANGSHNHVSIASAVVQGDVAESYTQFSSCVKGEIAIATEMHRVVTGTDAAAQVQDRLQALNREKAGVDGKIILLREALNLPSNPDAAAQSNPNASLTSAPPVDRSLSHAAPPPNLRWLLHPPFRKWP